MKRSIRTILRFTKEEAEVQKQALPFVPARYIRTFDVISEGICVLLRRRRRIEKEFVSARYIRTSEAFSEHERHPSGFQKIFPSFSKECLSLRYSANFRRSRLVQVCFLLHFFLPTMKKDFFSLPQERYLPNRCLNPLGVESFMELLTVILEVVCLSEGSYGDAE